MDILILFVLGVGVGFVSGFFGIGGGGVLVPVLMLLDFNIKEAIGISIMQMIFSSIFGSYLNHKKRLFKLHEGLYVGLGGASGALTSGFLVKYLSAQSLTFALAFALLFSIYKFFLSNIQNQQEQNYSPIIFYIIGLFIGSTAISIGIGGAMFLTPILVGFLHVDLKKAISMGLFFVVFSSISGFISLSYNELIDYKTGFIVAIGSLFGVYFGTKSSHAVEKNLQKKLLLVLYILMFGIIVSKLF